jgi:hypothetical protein
VNWRKPSKEQVEVEVEAEAEESPWFIVSGSWSIALRSWFVVPGSWFSTVTRRAGLVAPAREEQVKVKVEVETRESPWFMVPQLRT